MVSSLIAFYPRNRNLLPSPLRSEARFSEPRPLSPDMSDARFLSFSSIVPLLVSGAAAIFPVVDLFAGLVDALSSCA